MPCRFVLSEVKENEIAHEEGYNIFEPAFTIEIDGTNVFQALGVDGVRNVVFMHFLERVIDGTAKMVREILTPKGEYDFWLYGTGFGITTKREGPVLDVRLKVDGKMGPVQGVEKWPRSVSVGKVEVKDWVQALVSQCRSLSQLLQKVNHEVYMAFEHREGPVCRNSNYGFSRGKSSVKVSFAAIESRPGYHISL